MSQERIKILIDNGHGEDTPGKRSPDGTLREYLYTRDIAQRVSRGLSLKGYDAILLTPEKWDVSIGERARRANAWARKLGSGNVVLVSIHLNAAGSGSAWGKGRGWQVLVDDAASDASRRLAGLLFDETEKRGLKTRRYTPERKWYRYGEATGRKGERLGILKGTACPAVLTENFFMDNREEAEWLLSDEGRQAVAAIHVAALMEYCNTL